MRLSDEKSLNFFYSNLQSILGEQKLKDFNISFSDNNTYDLIAGTETWLNDSVADTEILNDAYHIYRHDRQPPRCGGGVLLAVSTLLRSRLLDAAPIPNCESVWVEILLDNNKRLIVGVVYIPPNSNPACIEQLSITLSNIIDTLKENDYVTLFGDFNQPGCEWILNNEHTLYPLLKSRSISNCIFLECIAENNLKQHVHFPTRGENFLDLLFTSETLMHVDVNPVRGLLNSDHLAIEGSLEVPAPTLRHIPPARVTRAWKRVNLALFKDALRSCPWELMDSTTSVDDCCELFYDLLDAVIADNVPTTKTGESRFPHWYSKDTIAAYKDKRRAHRRWKRSHLQSDYIEFSEKRRLFKYKTYMDDQLYKSNIQEALCNDPSKLFKFANNKMKSKRIPNTLTYNDVTLKESKDIANGFSSFFKKNMLPETVPVPQTYSTDMNIPFTIVLREDIQRELEAVQCNKSVGSDPIPSKIVKLCAAELSHPLYILFNQIFLHKIFPSQWKVAHVTPVFKKGKKSKVENYRPISLLPIFSKIFETFLYELLYHELHSILPDEQHGFVPKRSTVTNLIEYSHELSNNINSKVQTDVIYLDFAKAFDRVSHSLLIKKLHFFNINPSLLMLLSSYLQNRTQVVCIDSVLSDPVGITSGVPQGSLLGPLLFIAYVSDLPKCLQFAKCLMYADDTKIFMAVHKISDCLLLQQDLNSLYEWCKKWKLSLNLDKCEIMSVSNRVNTVEFNYHIGDVELERVNHVTDLGVVFENNMSFNLHIDKICKSAAKVMGIIKRSCSGEFEAYTVKRLYVALVRPILEYASQVWNPQFTTKCDRVERIQRIFLRTYCYKLRLQYDSAYYTDFCRLAGIHSLKSRRTISDLMFLYKILNGTVHSNVVEAVCLNAPLRVNRSFPIFKPPRARIDILKHSYMHRVQQSFNEIVIANPDLDLFNMSLSVFKTNLLKIFY